MTVADGELLPFNYRDGMTYDADCFKLIGTKLYAYNVTDDIYVEKAEITLGSSTCLVDINPCDSGEGSSESPFRIATSKQMQNVTYIYFIITSIIK